MQAEVTPTWPALGWRVRLRRRAFARWLDAMVTGMAKAMSAVVVRRRETPVQPRWPRMYAVRGFFAAGPFAQGLRFTGPIAGGAATRQARQVLAGPAAGTAGGRREVQGGHISPEPRINERIRVPEVRLVGPNGEQVGIVAIGDALRLAQEADLDLVEVAPTARPPVCKLMDYGKFKYESALKAREARSHRRRGAGLRGGATQAGRQEHDHGDRAYAEEERGEGGARRSAFCAAPPPRSAGVGQRLTAFYLPVPSPAQRTWHPGRVRRGGLSACAGESRTLRARSLRRARWAARSALRSVSRAVGGPRAKVR